MKAKTLVLAFVLAAALPVSAYAAAGPLDPVITLTGGSVLLTQGSSYFEPGYLALDPTDGDITSTVAVANGVNSNQPGDYTVGYSVTDSLGFSDSESRSVHVEGSGGISNPCIMNGTCPCPMTPDPITGAGRQAWKSCVVANYPKLSDGSTLVCRLQALMPWETKPKCAVNQAGFGEEKILANGTEVSL